MFRTRTVGDRVFVSIDGEFWWEARTWSDTRRPSALWPGLPTTLRAAAEKLRVLTGRQGTQDWTDLDKAADIIEGMV